MPYDLIQINTRRRPTRLAFVIVIAAASLWSFYAVRWYIGNTMAEYFNTEENDLELARVARTLSPKDPLTHWRLGQVSQKKLPLDQSPAVLVEYERAVGLSPNDYRLWMTLGIARGQAGELEKAEPALRQAVALAPYYAYPRWYLGNLLLRSGSYEEGFAELQKASEADPEELRSQLFNLVVAVYGNDLQGAVKAVGTSAEARANFATYLLTQNKFDDGVAVWNTLSTEEKKANRVLGESLVTDLVSNRRFHSAVALWNDIPSGSGYKVEEGKIADGDFEESIGGPSFIFGWQVKNVPQMQIGIDPEVSHSGQRSLRIIFQVSAEKEPISISQLVPVATDASYDFECFVKTEKLQSGGPPVLQIIDGENGSVLASYPAPTGDNEWTRIGLTFKTSSKTEAVTVRIVRASCGQENEESVQVCPIFGTVWYDDFSFKRHN